MKIEDNRSYAVLTGDIIESSKLSSDVRQDVVSAISSITKDMVSIFNDVEIIGPNIYRGDGWQMLFSTPRYAMKAAFYVRAHLKANYNADTRVCVGIGPVDSLPSEGLSQASGPAFYLSGTGLDTLKKKDHMSCWFIEPVRELNPLNADEHTFLNAYINSALFFASRLADGWTKAEAWAIYKTLEGATQEGIASDWIEGDLTSQQNVAKTLERAGWSAIDQFLNVFDAYTEKDRTNQL